MEPGRVIAGRYRLERLVGSGGMGSVYLARDERDGRPVAIKALTPAPHDDPQRHKRFLREAWAVSKLSHPSIVQIYERGEEPDGASWIAMEFIDGVSLAAVLDRGALPLHEVAHVIVPVARALAAAHRAGFVHRDVKPDNILVRGNGTPVLVDFGITRRIQHHAVNHGTVDQLTRTGMIVGTPEYMSPEQVRGLELDGRSDQFSLAVVCFEALTGSRPFVGDGPMAVIAAVLTDPVPLVHERVEGVPAEVGEGIARALSKKPADRFDDMQTFANLLDAYVPTDMRGVDVRSLLGDVIDADDDLSNSRTMVDVVHESFGAPTTEPSRERLHTDIVVDDDARTALFTAPELADAGHEPALSEDLLEVDDASALIRDGAPSSEASTPDEIAEARASYGPLQSPPHREAPSRRGAVVQVSIMAALAMLAIWMLLRSAR